MHTRTTALAATLLSFFILHSTFFISRAAAQAVAQPSLIETAASKRSEAGPIPVTTTTTGTSAPRPGEEDDIVEMSVFEVNSSTDVGYAGGSTTSGSRLNTALRDTAASIDVLTQEFLQDVGAASIEELLSYAGNMEGEFEDATNGFNNNPTRDAGTLDNRFRIRGISANVSLDYTETGVPIDLYNIDRAEISSGANSILFGMGSQGGMLTLTSKRANLQRNTARVNTSMRSYLRPTNTWHYFRGTLDYNIVLIPRKLAFRLNGMYQDGGNRSWQDNANNHVKRINPLVTVRPVKGMTISASYERGHQKESTFRGWNASDMLTAWLDYRDLTSSEGVMQGFGTDYALGSLTYLRPNGTPYSVNIATQNSATNNIVFIGNDSTIINTRRAYTSNNRWPTGMTNRNQIRLPAHLSSYYSNTVGPSGYRLLNFERMSATLEQRIGNFNFELAFHHNKVKGIAHSPSDIDPSLYGDVNSFYSAPQFVDQTANSVITNPHAGELYMQATWKQNYNDQTNNAIRLTSEATFKLKKFGRHRVVAFLEHTENDAYANTEKEILVDKNQRAIFNADDPTGAANTVTRRQYVTEGDFSTYYDGDWTIPIEPVTIGDAVYHTTYVATGQDSASHVRRQVNSAMFTVQSYMFNDKLVTTLGLRLDRLRMQEEDAIPVADPNDPRILNKTKVLNEYALEGKWKAPKFYNPWSYSIGAVWHAFDRLSFFGNYSTNIAAPYINRHVLPDGDLPDPAKGKNVEYGVLFSILGNDKLNLRLTRFDTRQLGDATITPAGTVDPSNAAIGSTNLQDIFDAMYFLYPTHANGNQRTWSNTPPNGWPVGTGPGAGPMAAADYAVTHPEGSAYNPFTYGAPPRYNAATVDVVSRGYELSLTANITKKFTMKFAFSYSDRYRENVFPEIFEYYNKMIPIWMDMIDPAKNGGKQYMVVIPGNGTNQPNATNASSSVYAPAMGAVQRASDGLWEMPLLEYVRRQLYAPDNGSVPARGTDYGSLRTGLNSQLNLQSGALGSRPFKCNVTARYSFRNGFFKGLLVGGSARYSSYNLMPDPARERVTVDMPPDGVTDLQLDPKIYFDAKTMIHGDSLYNFSAFMIYKCKLFGGRINARFQLNVDNILNDSVVTYGRILENGAIRRVYVNNPRTIQFSTEFEF